MLKLKAASELGFSCRESNGIVQKFVNHEYVDFTPEEQATIEARVATLLSIDHEGRALEANWIDSELTRVRDLIEDAEDTKTLVPKLRAYRQALKQYKSDLYMSNVSRPTL